MLKRLGKEGIAPVGYPRFEPKTVEEGKDLEFIAIFEVYPEIEAVELDLAKIKLEKPEAEIKEKDVSKT